MDQRLVLVFLLVLAHRALTSQIHNQMEDNRVVGGRPALVNEFPYQVAFRVRGSPVALCGGSIIADRWILTAAHCFHDKNKLEKDLSKFEIVAGTTHIAKSTGVWKIEKLFLKRYDDDTTRNDIALVKTRTPLLHAKRRSPHRVGSHAELASKPAIPHIAFTMTGVQPRELPEGRYLQRLEAIEIAKPGQGLQDWATATISGFGTIRENGTASSQMLAATLNLLPDKKCAKVYEEYRSDMMMCAGRLDGGHDACQGDSGGPLVLSLHSKPLLVGITSFGDGCGKKGSPGVYTRVSYFYNWIMDKMEHN